MTEIVQDANCAKGREWNNRFSVAGLRRVDDFPNVPGLRRSRRAADLEIGDTAGWETCATRSWLDWLRSAILHSVRITHFIEDFSHRIPLTIIPVPKALVLLLPSEETGGARGLPLRDTADCQSAPLG